MAHLPWLCSLQVFCIALLLAGLFTASIGGVTAEFSPLYPKKNSQKQDGQAQAIAPTAIVGKTRRATRTPAPTRTRRPRRTPTPSAVPNPLPTYTETATAVSTDTPTAQAPGRRQTRQALQTRQARKTRRAQNRREVDASVTEILESDDPHVRYSDAWDTTERPRASGGSFEFSTETDAFAETEVSGIARFKLRFHKGPNSGIAEIRVDGQTIATLDTYAEKSIFQTEGPFTLPDEGPHTLTVFVTGTHNPESQEPRVALNSFRIILDDEQPSTSVHTFSGGVMGLNSTVDVMLADDEGNVYFGGAFTMTADGNTPLSKIARWNFASSSWYDLGGGMDSSVRALAYDTESNTLYAAGLFSTAGSCGASCNRIAQWNGST